MPATLRRHRLFTVMLCLSLVGLTVTPRVARATDPAPAGADHDRQVLQGEYEKVLGEEAVALRELPDTIQRRQGVELQLLSIERQIQATAAKLDQASVVFVQANASRVQALIDLNQAEKQLAAAKTELTAQVVTGYVTGGREDDGLDSVLTGGEQKGGQTQTYASAVVRHQKVVIRDYNAAKAERDRQAGLASDAESKARASRDDIAGYRSTLETRKVEQVGVQRDLFTEQWIEQTRFNDLDETKAQIVIKVLGLARDGDRNTFTVNHAQAGQAPFTFPLLPLVDPTPGAAYTQGFGPQKQPVLGVQSSHPGIDLAGPAGAQVHAAGDGRVILAGPLGSYGNTVIIDHGNHLTTLYGHNQQVLVSVGQEVKQNDVISLRGSTGISTGPHVHFETRVNGVPVDPLLFIRLT